MGACAAIVPLAAAAYVVDVEPVHPALPEARSCKGAEDGVPQLLAGIPEAAQPLLAPMPMAEDVPDCDPPYAVDPVAE